MATITVCKQTAHTAMGCPFCQHSNTQVADPRLLEETNSIRRRYRYSECGRHFSILETAEMRMPQATKTNGARVTFNPRKLRTNLSRALHKRPVPPETIDEAIVLIEQRLYQLGCKEVPSRLVGEMVVEELAKADQVVYVHFASVYRSFNDISGFTQVIATLPKDRPAEQAAVCQEGV